MKALPTTKTAIRWAWYSVCLTVIWLGSIAYLLGFNSIGHLITGVWP